MRRLVLLSLLCLLAVAAGCSGDDGDEGTVAAGTTTAPATTAPATTASTDTAPAAISGGTPNPAMGQTLLRIVKAAGRPDPGGMWSELSIPTRASLGPTLQDFSGGNASEFALGLGTLAPSARIVLSRQIGDSYGVAAIAGTRKVDGKDEEFAYGAALLQEDNRWKLELGGIVITGLAPEPLEKVGRRPQIASNVGAAGQLIELHMWLDGKPLRVRNNGLTPFTAKLTAVPPTPLKAGRHVAITFAATDETATATAWPFTVEA